MADNIVNARIQNRYDIEASWASYDPVLYKGELAFSSDKGFQYKIGDGSSKWSALEYAQAGSLYGLTASIQELNYLSGATSNVQTQLDSKAESNKVGAALQVSGTTVRLVNAAGEILSTITTQDTTYTGGTGISISGTTINHSNSISAGSVSGSSGSVSEGGTVKIPSITYDAQGHITAASTTSITLPTVDLSGYLPLTGGTLTGQLLVKTNANPAIGVTGSSTSVSTWVKVTDANGAQVSFGIGTSNNKGLYDHDTSTWMFYKDSSNALHVGPSTVGSNTKPIYLNSGVPTAFSSTVGSGVIPMYLSSGTLTASSSTVGSGTKPIYLNSGTITVSSSTVGSGVIPMYLSSGTLTASSSTVGSGTKPVYLSSGTITVSSSTVGSSTVPVYLNSGTITACSGVATSSDLSNYLPLSGGTLTGTVTMSTSSGSPRFYVKRTDTGQAVSMGLGSGGYNRGLYDDKQGKWLFYADEDNAVHINGTATVGGAAKPIYLSSGTPTACSSTVGSATQPVYMSSGTITACSTTVGSGTKPIYSNSGVLTAFSSTVGSSTTPVYLNSGTITACSAMVTSSQLTDGSVTKLGTSTYGSTSQPIYWNAGVPAALTATVGSGTKPIYSNAGVLTASSSTVGSATQPVYMSSGTITACSTTVGGTAKPIYSNGGVLTAISSTVGSGTQPCYLSSGTITACGSTVGSSTKPIYSSSGVLTACSSTVGSSTTPVYMSSGTITACSLSSTYAPYSDIYSGSKYTYFSDIPDDSYNRLTYLQYTSGTDSTAPDTSSYSDWWWNVISVGYSNRKLQLTACPFRNRPILYMRQKHDSSWYGWYEFHSTKIGTSAPSSLTTGEIYMVYSA